MLKYSAAGNFIDKWTSTDNLGGSLFFYGIATDAVGDIYVVAGGNLGEKILKFHEVPFAAEAGNNNKFKKIKVIVRCPLTDCIADLNGKARIPIRNPGPKRGLATAAKSKAFKVKKKRVELSAGERKKVGVKFKNKKSIRKINRLLKNKPKKKKANATIRVIDPPSGAVITVKVPKLKR